MQKVIVLKWGTPTDSGRVLWNSANVVIGKQLEAPLLDHSRCGNVMLLAFMLFQVACLTACWMLQSREQSYDSVIPTVSRSPSKPLSAVLNPRLLQEGTPSSSRLNVLQRKDRECMVHNDPGEICALSNTASRYARVRSITLKLGEQLNISSISDWAVTPSVASDRIGRVLSASSSIQPGSGPASYTNIQFSPYNNNSAHSSCYERSIYNPPLRKRAGGVGLSDETWSPPRSSIFSPQLLVGHRDFANHPFLMNCSVSREELEAIVRARIYQRQRRILAPGVGWVSAKRLLAEMAIEQPLDTN